MWRLGDSRCSVYDMSKHSSEGSTFDPETVTYTVSCACGWTSNPNAYADQCHYDMAHHYFDKLAA